ncbi:ketopantoate reductase PanE/ApbA C terminal-domain-containing protein [Schizophyllum amplum]|uniref:Ketopantoate reductase PanE/ApbA C terminal-domain-containing protein n=1 Tax=Schizophyllum amplum TaxID=97359 RepID=A0A550CQJ9_9AGAR|nr:ketopantoate reductase PanE/ApbA C terminal-domain-containing protein [Auriculariopsis ampla]
MAAPLKEVLLVGYGGVGAIYSLILKRSGLARVTVAARSNYALANSEGMHFKSQKYGEITGWKPDRLVSSVAAAADQTYSYVFLTTKCIPDIIKTPALVAPLLSAPYADEHRQPVYVLMQNGINVEKDLYDAVKALGKGEPRIDRVTLGIYRPHDFTTTTNTPAEQAILDDIAAMLSAGGSTVDVVPEIQRKKFAKNFWNVGFSSFATLTGYTVPALFRPPPREGEVYARPGGQAGEQGQSAPYVFPKTADKISEYAIEGLRGVLRELVDVGRALGFPDSDDGLPSSLVDSTIENTRKVQSAPHMAHIPSMLLDAQKGYPIEVEAIVGEVVRMARERGVQVPRVELLYALLLVKQNQILREQAEKSGRS